MKKLLAIGLLTISMGGLASACGGVEESDSCSSDSDCKGDRICEAGECVSPASSNPNSSTPTNSTPNNSSTPTNSTPNNSSTPTNSTPNNSTPTNNTAGSDGSECTSSSDCDSSYCREEAGAFGGTCAVNDFGDMCEGNADCEYGACLFENPDVDVFGYCTAQCESFTDCPTFWNCEDVGNASGTYCIQG